MNGFAASVLAPASGLVGVALGDLLSEEIRTRLEKVPRTILRLASRADRRALRRDVPAAGPVEGQVGSSAWLQGDVLRLL
jgi:hypothetical protein